MERDLALILAGLAIGTTFVACSPSIVDPNGSTSHGCGIISCAANCSNHSCGDPNCGTTTFSCGDVFCGSTTTTFTCGTSCGTSTFTCSTTVGCTTSSTSQSGSTITTTTS
jgi:hypothetical protein